LKIHPKALAKIGKKCYNVIEIKNKNKKYGKFII